MLTIYLVYCGIILFYLVFFRAIIVNMKTMDQRLELLKLMKTSEELQYFDEVPYYKHFLYLFFLKNPYLLYNNELIQRK